MASINLPTSAKQDAIQTKVDGIDTKSTTINTNLNTANTNINSLLSRGYIKSIQKGTSSIASGTSFLSVTINAVNQSKTMIIVNGFHHNAAGNETYPLIINGTSNTSFSAALPITSQTNITFSWQIIEFY